MAIIKSGATSDQWTINPTSKGGRVELYDAAGAVIGADGNPLIVDPGIPLVPANGGFYSVAGRTGTAAIAATLAADTNLAAMRFAAASSRTAYVHLLQIFISIITVGTSGLVPGTLGLQRFTAGNPSGGTARTPNEQDESGSDTSDMTVIQDLASALTMTSVVFGTEIAWVPVPIVITGAQSSFLWEIRPAQPIKLAPGDGLTMRTRIVMPGTQTWMFHWNAWWQER